MNRLAAATVEPERQAAELAAMRRMIEAARGCFSLSIAICNSPALRDYLITEIRKSLVGLRVVSVPRGTIDVYGQVVAEVPETPPDGLFIVNVESSVPSDAESQPSLRSLNASRELWEQRYACPVVFWLPEFAATLLAIHAPDFWRYRSHRFEFVSEQAGAIEGLGDRFAGNVSVAASLSADEKRFRIAELEQRIAEAGEPPPPELARHVSIWLSELGFLFQFIGDLDSAEQALRKSLSIDEKLGWQEGMAADHSYLGLIHEARGNLDRAEDMLRKSLAIEEKLGHQEGMASDYGNLGHVYQARGDLDRAEEMVRKSLAVFEELGQQDGMAISYGNLGLIYKARGDLDRADEMFRKSLAINEKLGRREGMANSYNNLGLIYKARGDLDRADEMFRKSLAINERLGRREGMANSYGNLGVLYRKRGDIDKAKDCLTRALTMFQNIGASDMVQKTQNILKSIKQEGNSRR